MAVDPICGMTVDEATALSTERDGVWTYFCCEACRRKFHGLPPRPTASTHPWFCPMCEGVGSARPGICPKCGMALESNDPGGADSPELPDMIRRFKGALCFGLPVFLIAMAPMLASHPAPRYQTWLAWVQLVLSTPVVFWSGAPLFQRAWISFRSLQLNMFSLIALGVGAAYASSVLFLIAPGLLPAAYLHGGVPLYFETASTIVTLVLLGQVMELRTRMKTGDAVRQLLTLIPATACVVRDGGREEQVPVKDLVVGDLIRLRPGSRIPVDGQVQEGRGTLDLAIMTGEAEPVEADRGTSLLSGSILTSGTLLMQATRVGQETFFARVVTLVKEAQRSRAPVQHLADRAAAIFTPAVILIAALVFAGWWLLAPPPALTQGLVSAISILVVACPCALGLATPMAITVGLGRAAREGILVRDASLLERLRHIDTLVIDKTGTLTEGKLTLTGLETTHPGYSEDEILAFAAAVEERSEHPIARAVVTLARERQLTWHSVEAFASQAGQGVSGTVSGRAIAIRRAQAGARSAPLAGTAMQITIDGVPAGTLSFRDQVRSSAPRAIESLRRMGIEVILLTGDNAAAAARVAQELHLDDIRHGMTPEGKLETVRALKAAGRTVAMAGDGVNDAPALALADLGIAMGSGTDAAIETAGVVLLRNDLEGLARTFRLSRLVLRNIQQNLFWAFAYNLASLTLAAGVLYPLTGTVMNPMIAATAMSFSSISVMANALRLKTMSLTTN